MSVKGRVPQRWSATRAAALAAVLVASCATSGSIPVAYSEYREGEDFRSYQRFAWLEGTSEARRSTQPAEHKLHERILAALEAA